VIPQTLVLSKDGKVIYQKHGYHIGDEDEIETVLKNQRNQ